jgi:hypothetical protein
MKIKNLPKGIKKKAKEYAKKDFPNKEYRPDDLASSFRWGSTKEGFGYWDMVCSGEFLKAEELLVKKAKEELERLKEENPLMYRVNQLNEDACWTGTSTACCKETPFFLDEVLDFKVNEPEVLVKPWYLTTDDAPISYKEELEVIDPIVEAVREKLKQRSSIGIKKYGTTLADNNTDDFLNHLQEELMDSILYIEKLKNK